MAVCRAFVSHLLLPSPSPPNPSKVLSPNPNKILVPNSSPIGRRFFLFSLPISSLLLFTANGESARTSSCLAAEGFDPVSSAERGASALLSRRIAEAVELLDKGRELQAQGDFGGALRYFSKVHFRPP